MERKKKTPAAIAAAGVFVKSAFGELGGAAGGLQAVLLVPKWIVRKNFLFKAHQYLYSVIVERIRKKNGWDDLKKIDIWNTLPRVSEHWEYDTVIAYTREHPEALSEYHDHMPRFYGRTKGHMTDQDLDSAVYGRRMKESA
ncbi:MAG: hypothetical protein AAGU32_03430 [Bacillota bacterium]